MQTSRDRLAINSTLGRHGLATLENPRGMIAQIGFLIQDHDHFRRMLTKCEPDQRRAMYESLRPHLSFTAKPLDVYISEAGANAEARQLPTIGPDGQLRPFSPTEVISEIVEDAIAKFHLEVTCRKCTKTAVFPGVRKVDAVQKARDAGWVCDQVGDTKYEICPDCPATRN